MADSVTVAQRSAIMSKIRGKNTKPELIVRRILRELGVGYRLHIRKLPGQPDIVMAGRKQIIFVHGCFWHQHVDCKIAHMPKSRLEFWKPKLERNVSRDLANYEKLQNEGWDVLTVWECEIADEDLLRLKLANWLKPLTRRLKRNHRRAIEDERRNPTSDR